MNAGKSIGLILIVSLLVGVALLQGIGPLYSRQTLILAHNLDTNHPVHRGMEAFAKDVREKSDGQIDIKLYANGQLGSEREVLEQLQIGAVAFTKVSSMSLESFAPIYSAINAPYIFQDEAHSYRVLDGELGEELLGSTVNKRFRGLTYYASGARSFYANKPILKPEDFAGMKLRVMGSQTAIKMTQLLGGSPAPMPFGEVYTGLQQNVIDGAESSITALTMNRHGEVAKHLSLDEHIIAPDVLLVSTKVWSSLTKEQQDWIKEAAENSKELQREYWRQAVEEHTKIATDEMGVEIHRPDKTALAALVEPLHQEMMAANPDVARVMTAIKTQNSAPNSAR